MTAPTTAPTPEELATRIELVGTEAAQEEIRQDIAAAIRQHSAPLEAQVAELTTELQSAHEALTDARIPIMDDDMRVLGVDERVLMLKGALSAMTAENFRLKTLLRLAPKSDHFDIVCDALAEIKATIDGEGHPGQTVEDIVNGCLAEIAALPKGKGDLPQGWYRDYRAKTEARAALQTKEDGNVR